MQWRRCLPRQDHVGVRTAEASEPHTLVDSRLRPRDADMVHWSAKASDADGPKNQNIFRDPSVCNEGRRLLEFNVWRRNFDVVWTPNVDGIVVDGSAANQTVVGNLSESAPLEVSTVLRRRLRLSSPSFRLCSKNEQVRSALGY